MGLNLSTFRSGFKFIRTYAHTLALALQIHLLGEEIYLAAFSKTQDLIGGNEALPFLKNYMSR